MLQHVLVRVGMGLGLGILLASTTQAAEPRFEFTPFYTQRGGGGFDDANKNDTSLSSKSGAAIAIDWPSSEHGSQYELLYSRQNTIASDSKTGTSIDMRVEYLQLGGTTLVGDEASHVVPYAAGGLGVARFTPGAASLLAFTQEVTPGTTASLQTQETHLAFSLGGGVRIPITNHIRLRLEARGYLTWLNGSSVFCHAGAATSDTNAVVACPLQTKGQTFFQYEALGGVSIGF